MKYISEGIKHGIFMLVQAPPNDLAKLLLLPSLHPPDQLTPAGGQQCRLHHHDPQLPPQAGQHPLHAQVGLHRLPPGAGWRVDSEEECREKIGGMGPTCLFTRLESSLVPARFLTAQFLQKT